MSGGCWILRKRLLTRISRENELKHDAYSLALSQNMTGRRRVLPKIPGQGWLDALGERLGLADGTTIEVIGGDYKQSPGEVIQRRSSDERTWHTYYVATDLEFFAAIGIAEVEKFIDFCELGPMCIG